MIRNLEKTEYRQATHIQYSHYGKQAEVWKHLPLCDIIALERPTVYVETNSAYADYTLSGTPEQQYGIYHFLEKGKQHPIKDSLYFQQEYKAMQTNKYIGSPGLVMSILKDNSKYIFFDLDNEALQSIDAFGKSHNLTNRIELHNQDSIAGMIELLPSLPKTTLIHIDPYLINVPGPNGYTYLDIFKQATELGLKCFLWYGYQTLNEKEELEQLIKSTCNNNAIHSLSCHELTLCIIERETQPCTPGVMGSGLLTSNLSSHSRQKIEEHCDLLVNFYQKTNYRQWSGELYKDIVL
ncbi:hypothetical protein [Bacteroides sp.]